MQKYVQIANQKIQSTKVQEGELKGIFVMNVTGHLVQTDDLKNLEKLSFMNIFINGKL
jgi:hypothetical protein